MDTPRTPMSWPGYLAAMLATAVLAVGAVGAFNALIDPLGAFGGPAIAGVNARKPYLDHHREQARWARARRACAPAAIFGNSRAEIGFDPEHPAFAAHGTPAFNHAIPGTKATTALRQLGWLEAAGCMPRLMVVGVDFFDFLGGEAMPLPARDPHDDGPRTDAAFLAETVFSLSGLRDALQTVAIQRASHPTTLTERGFNPLLNYVPEVAISGHYVLFRQRADENARRWMIRAPRLAPEGGGESIDQLVLEAMLDRAGATGGETHLVIYPYHAQIRLMIDGLGLNPLFDAWKRDLVARAGRRAARGERVVLWDFSGISETTREAIPPRGDKKTQLARYWEAGHFKKALGDRVLARVLGSDDEGFGIRLDAGNIDAHLAADARAVEALKTADAALVAETADVLRAARR